MLHRFPKRHAPTLAALAAVAFVASCSASSGDRGTTNRADSGSSSGATLGSSSGGQNAGAADDSGGTGGGGGSGSGSREASGQASGAAQGVGGAQSGSSGEATSGSPGAERDAGETPDTGGSRQGADSGSASGDGGASSEGGGRDSGASQGVGSACAPPVSPVVETDPDGPGYDCMTSGCHLPSAPVQGGLTITVSGTLYDGTGKPLPGATVYVTDSAGVELVLTTDNNANFWSGYSDGQDSPAGNYGTCLSYVKCYPPSLFEGACECATHAATGALQAASVSMCPNETMACGSLGKAANNGECHTCHGTTGASPAIRLP
jgi:hypothetical protein